MKKLSAFLAIICLAVFFIYSCQKDKSDATSPAVSSNNFRTTVTGIVLDESNAPLNGVTVTAYGQTTTTNQYGTFVLKNLNANKDRCVLQFTKAGFFNRAHGLIASANTVNYVRIVLLSNAGTQSFSASVGGIISLPDGSSAEFEPNSIVTSTGSAYTGTVNLIVKHLSPDDANFGFTIPGGDLAAVNANNEDVVLYTYGMLGVELTGSSGEALQLAAGTSATLTMAIAASQLSSAPASIPLWYFDESTSLWKEEGAANKVGSNYVGTVAHFSWWNCDYGGPKSYLHGKVVDCNGVPVSNVAVSLNGQYEVTTDQNGVYNDWIPSGLNIIIQFQVLSSNNGGLFLQSQIETIPTLSPNQTFVIPDLIASCPSKISGTLKNCAGENTDGLVMWTYNNFNFASYSETGSFELIAPTNSTIQFMATNGAYSYAKNITTLSAGITLNLNTVQLCDTSFDMPDNSFSIYDAPCANDTLIINSGNLFGRVLGNYTAIHFNLGNNGTFNLYAGSTPGVYDWFHSSSTNISIQLNSWGTIISNVNVSGKITLIEIGPVGGIIKGTFIGTVWLNRYYGSDCWGTIKGKFNVPRIQ